MKTLIKNSLATALMVGSVAIIAMTMGCAEEPQQDGIPLSNWIKQLSNADMAFRIEAAEAIGAIGKPARAKAEPMLTTLAENDPMPKVRVAAIMALKAIGAPSAEFEAYLEEVTAPLNEPSDEDLQQGSILDEDGEINEDMLFNGLQKDDLEFLQELENQLPDSVVPESNMPMDPNQQQEWIESRRKEQVESVLQQFRNPDVLADMLSLGEPLEKRFAARLLANQEGSSERIFDALKSASEDSDTLLAKLAKEALKKWQRQ